MQALFVALRRSVHQVLSARISSVHRRASLPSKSTHERHPAGFESFAPVIDSLG
jgi:hypothetical protein